MLNMKRIKKKLNQAKKTERKNMATIDIIKNILNENLDIEPEIVIEEAY